ncbi:hypothetical protein HY212_07340 [Candidatus Pacearchaeota archaeon]|nr:hypothetical protein [Candidatus Pacearchaeota archaeon]
MKNPPKSKKKGTFIAIAIGMVIIGLVITFSYYTDQARIAGQRFGENLAQIQEDLKKNVSDYESKLSLYQKGNLTKQQILAISDSHLAELEKILSRYESLKPPQPFITSLELFKRSTQTQFESEKLFKQWIETGDESFKIRSDQLLQQSFDYESNALALFEQAKKGIS